LLKHDCSYKINDIVYKSSLRLIKVTEFYGVYGSRNTAIIANLTADTGRYVPGNVNARPYQKLELHTNWSQNTRVGTLIVATIYLQLIQN